MGAGVRPLGAGKPCFHLRFDANKTPNPNGLLYRYEPRDPRNGSRAQDWAIVEPSKRQISGNAGVWHRE